MANSRNHKQLNPTTFNINP